MHDLLGWEEHEASQRHRDYVKEFYLLMLEIPNITEEELLFNFMGDL